MNLLSSIKKFLSDHIDLPLELLIWGCSIILSLSHLVYVVLSQYLTRGTIDIESAFIGSITEGRLLFFATTLVMASYANVFLKSFKANAKVTLVVGGIFVIIVMLTSASIYSQIIFSKTASSGISINEQALTELTRGVLYISFCTSLGLKMRSLQM